MARSGAGIGAGRTRILPGDWRSQAALRPRRPPRRSGQRRLDPPWEEQLDDVDGDRRGILRRQLAAVGQHHERALALRVVEDPGAVAVDGPVVPDEPGHLHDPQPVADWEPGAAGNALEAEPLALRLRREQG